MEDQLVSFKVAKLAQLKGFKLTTHIWCNSENIVKVYNNSGKICTEICYDPDFDLNNEFPDIPAPTQSLLQKWLREQYNIFVTVQCDCQGNYDYHGYDVDYKVTSFVRKECQVDEAGMFEIGAYPYRFKTYEEALEAGLQEALKLI